ncbi:hypothetical protein IAQ61_003673 [Plenodomus lingam]|uniref:uncharacterized protein n=1 Tax=Leptosphaeria maculans TaxID=5022 RepID=UPI0033203B55|nr:hypothetical protein IAQ61_003673 [Plenodomus lingam]
MRPKKVARALSDGPVQRTKRVVLELPFEVWFGARHGGGESSWPCDIRHNSESRPNVCAKTLISCVTSPSSYEHLSSSQ